MHTGTYFVTKHLLSSLTERPIKHGIIGPGLYSDHVYPHKRGLWYDVLSKSDHVIVPLRHPAVVAESWKKRNRPKLELIEQFEELIGFVDQFQPLYLPLDVDDRDNYLGKINAATGLELETSWPVIHSKKATHDIDWRNLYPDDDIQEMIDANWQFFGRFYTRRRGISGVSGRRSSGDSRGESHE